MMGNQRNRNEDAEEDKLDALAREINRERNSLERANQVESNCLV
jgi:hypothetical protein